MVENGCLAKQLKTPDLEMQNSMRMLHLHLDLPETWYMVQRPIDGCFVTPDMTPLAVSYLENGVGLGDHILMMLYLPMCQIMGVAIPNIELSWLIWLTVKIPLSQKRYINTLKKMLEERV